MRGVSAATLDKVLEAVEGSKGASDIGDELFAVTALLDPTLWQVVAAETPTRRITHDGREIDVTDTVVRAVRRA